MPRSASSTGIVDYVKQTGNILGDLISMSLGNSKEFDEHEHLQTLLIDGQLVEDAIIA